MPNKEYKDVWLAIDLKTNRIIDFGDQGGCSISADQHSKISGNEATIRTLKIGMKIEDYR